MARNINKTRMRDTRLLMALTVLVGVFADTWIKDRELLRVIFTMTGLLLAAACAIGRVYTTAFIGGAKNEKLMTYGPYSLCRNPLYFFSLLGAAGIGLMSCSVLAFALIMGGFIFIYDGLITREEEFLAEKFGSEFEAFKARTPRLVPSFRNYNCPDELVFQPRYLNFSIRDAVWWFAALPLFEIARAAGVKPLLTLF
jgi:protein-S-isoprenylcysteine O-methyltransferase Ste14